MAPPELSTCHLLEFHFGRIWLGADKVELVIDRITMSPTQRRNLEDYLSQSPTIPLQRPFRIPQIEHVTMADSRYVEGLQLAHVFTEVLADFARNSTRTDVLELTKFFGVSCLIGQRQK